ncbi:MAG TPA: Ig-like domain-containing domain, partial [Bacteroidia bacterium]|nr:Ig-like domain-containing domain [Bacteroidia bacterium]
MLLKKISPLLIILLIYSCAGIVAPTGGPKDETPPKVKKVTPENKTTRFNASFIVFQIDEYVVLNDINNQFIMSPPQEKAPDINLRGKKVEVKFKEPLLPNTTYTINFGNGIKDNNEGNILGGLSYTFSTGDFIDSLSLSGSVKDGFTLLPSADAAIGLYEIKDDSTIFKNKPSYLVKPDETGSFTFNYLRPGTYQLVAFEDLNKNLKIESSEKIAFYSDLITLSYAVKESLVYNLLLSPQQFDRSKPQLITVREQSKGEYMIITSGSKCNLVVNGYDFGYRRKVPSILHKPSQNCDTAFYYTSDSCYDSLILQIKIDTVTETYISRCKQRKYKTFELTSGETYMGFNFYDSLKLQFSNPVMDVDTTYIEL